MKPGGIISTTLAFVVGAVGVPLLMGHLTDFEAIIGASYAVALGLWLALLSANPRKDSDNEHSETSHS